MIVSKNCDDTSKQTSPAIVSYPFLQYQKFKFDAIMTLGSGR